MPVRIPAGLNPILSTIVLVLGGLVAWSPAMADDATGVSGVDIEDIRRQLDELRGQNDEIRRENEQMREEIDFLHADATRDWLTEQRAEDIKELVQDVLADADTRASLMGSGLMAGWSDGFFLGRRRNSC